MTFKLMLRGLIILIGLSQLQSCIIFGFDPEDRIYIMEFDNTSSSSIDIMIEFTNPQYPFEDIVVVEEGQKSIIYEFGAENNERAIQKALDDFDSFMTEFSIVIDGEVVKVWSGPSGSFGDSINSPFNYDSWLFESLTPDARNVVGKITFVITDEDLEE